MKFKNSKNFLNFKQEFRGAAVLTYLFSYATLKSPERPDWLSAADRIYEKFFEGKRCNMLTVEDPFIAKGFNRGIEHGILKGIKQKALELAVKLLDRGMHAEEVAVLTELDPEEVAKLRQAH